MQLRRQEPTKRKEMKSNAKEVLGRVGYKLTGLQKGNEISDAIMREVCFNMAREVGVRIHERGENSKGEQIGTYKPSYMRVRESNKYNRTSDTKVILSLTKDMELDFTAIVDGGSYGLGFKFPFNYQKSQWMDDRFKNIYQLSDAEDMMVTAIIIDAIRKLLN